MLVHFRVLAPILHLLSAQAPAPDAKAMVAGYSLT